MSNKQNDIFYENLKEISEEKQIADFHAKQMETLFNIITKKEEPVYGDDDKYDLERENKELLTI